MQVHFSYHQGSPHDQLEKIINGHVQKLDQLLVRFSPDLVHLHGTIDFGGSKKGMECSLSLWLPTARLNTKENGKNGKDVAVCMRTAFEHLEEQVKKHKEVLRREGEWKRKRYRSQRDDRKTEDGELHVQSRQQLRDYLEQVLPQLRLFLNREVRYQEIGGGLPTGQLQEEELLDEVVARALEHHGEFAGADAPFHRLLKEAIHTLNGAFSRNGSAEKPAGNARRSGDSVEGTADPVELCLASLPPKKRQVYVLHALEGFSFQEAAEVLGQLTSEVEEVFREVSQEVSMTIAANRPAAHA